MKTEIKKILYKFLQDGVTSDDAVQQVLDLFDVSSSLRFSEHEIDFAYFCGVFNTSGIDGLHKEIQRLKELGKEPHDIIKACRKQ
jgi:hypothetical protein